MLEPKLRTYQSVCRRPRWIATRQCQTLMRSSRQQISKISSSLVGSKIILGPSNGSQYHFLRVASQTWRHFYWVLSQSWTGRISQGRSKLSCNDREEQKRIWLLPGFAVCGIPYPYFSSKRQSCYFENETKWKRKHKTTKNTV